jgi:hypothetical protein
VKLTFNVFEKHRDEERRWPRYMFGGRLRTSTAALIVAFLAVWWVYDAYRPEPAKPPPPQVVPPGFVPDPNYTWVPRTRVEMPEPDNTFVPTPTSTVPPTPTTTVPPTPPPTTTSPPPFQLPCLLPPPFCPPSASPTPPAPQQPVPGPGPSPISAPPAS